MFTWLDLPERAGEGRGVRAVPLAATEAQRVNVGQMFS